VPIAEITERQTGVIGISGCHRGTWEVDRRSLAVALTVMEGLMPGLTLTGVCQVFDRRTNWKAF
jgi:hypothetical protein